MRTIFAILSLTAMVSTRYINFQPGFEYRYKLTSTADVHNLGIFDTKAKVGYTNVAEDPDGQEVFIRIYTLLIGPRGQMNAPNSEWDLSKWFSFWIRPHGEVRHVYHPPGELVEILAIKKGLAALFASSLHHDQSWMNKTKDGWQYHVQELGHEGLHNSTYTVKSHDDGEVFTKVRHSHPIKQAEGNYTKTLHFDNELGNIHTVHINESFRVLHKPKADFNPYHNTRPMHPENQFSDVDIPEMSALGNGQLVFMMRFETNEIPKRPEAELQKSSIELEQVNLKRHCKVNETDAQNYISGNLTCMRNQPREGSSQMSTCFDDITTNLQELSDDAVTKLADHFFRFDIRTRDFIADRNHMMDAIAFLHTELSQRILLDKVLSHPYPDPFLYLRYLVHIVSKDAPPLPEVISKLEDLVFSPDGFPKELQDGVSYHSTVLALGSVVGKLQANGMQERALGLVNKLHSWLGIHDPWQFRKKRSTLSEDDARSEDQWKVILLEAVGNAGLDQSFVFIESHVNSSNSNWVKRAGIHALRQYHHQRALSVILKTALYDQDEKVRYDATLQYKAHPLASMMAPVQSWKSSDNGSVYFADPADVGVYDLTAHGRRKRSVLDALNFELRSPSLSWAKVLGNEKVGASLEVLVNNYMKLDIKPLSGEVILNIHDEARAIIHLAIVFTNIDFFICRLCFKGHAEYNLNILQEFGVDNLNNLAKMYDEIKEKAIDAVKTAIETFKTLLNSEIPIGDIFAGFVTALEDMPEKILQLAGKSLDANRVMGEMDQELLPPFMRPAFSLVMRVSNLVSDVRSDVLSFYNTLRETVTVIMPYSAMQIVESMDKIISGFDEFNNNPVDAIKSMAGNIITVGSSVTNLIDALERTKNACFFLKGSRPYWWDLKTQISEIKSLSAAAVTSINNGAAKWLESAAKLSEDGKDEIAILTRGKYTTADMYNSVMEIGKTITTDILEPFDELKDLGGEFLKTYEKTEQLIISVKKAYNDLKEGYRTARSYIDQVFGPKCHKRFPRKVRLAGNGCAGNGGFVAKLDKPETPEYDSEGTDLVLSVDSEVVAPFGGNMYRSSNKNEVIIEPTGGSLKKTIIIISNIIPNDTVSHSRDDPDLVRAGEVIGKAARSLCDNHIHFALKRGAGYIDPKDYLKARLPAMPLWIQECDDYKLVYKGQTIREGSLIGSSGRADENTSPKRTGQAITNPANIPENKKPASQLTAASSQPDSMYEKQKENSEAIKAQTESTKDNALAKLFKKPLNFMKNFKVSSIKVGSLFRLMERMKLDESRQKLADIIVILKEMLDNKPCFNPHQMTDGQLRTELTERGMHAEGSRNALITRLSQPPCRCPGITLSLPKHVYCTIDSQCLGIECCAYFKLGIFRKTFKLYARLDACNFQFIVGVEKRFEKVFGASDGLKDMYAGFEKVLKTGVKIIIFNSELELIIKVTFEKDDKGAYITLGTGFCHTDDITNCMGFFNLVDMMPIMLPICLEDGTMKFPEFDYNKLFSREAIKQRLKENVLKTAKQLARNSINEILKQYPCMPSDAPGTASTCPRPDAMTIDLLMSELTKRNLPTEGPADVLKDRLYDASQECTVFNRTLRLPQLGDEMRKRVYLSVGDRCVRFEACLDLTIEKLDFHKAVKASLELDVCRSTLTIALMDCTFTLYLFNYKWGVPKVKKLSDKFSIKFNIDKDEEKDVFVVDFGLEFDSEELLFLQALEVPNPLCNNFQLPGSGQLKDLYKAMGTQLSDEVVDVFFKYLGLNTVLLDGLCTLPPPPPTTTTTNTTGCLRDVAMLTSHIPETFKSKVTCQLSESCFGLHCCIDFAFVIPAFENVIQKNVPFYFKFDPCTYVFEVGFGGFHHKENLISYNYGIPIILYAGGDKKPITIEITLSKIGLDFEISLRLTVCIPVDEETYCVPEEGIQLIQSEQILACDDVTTTQQMGSFMEWAESKVIDLTQGITSAAVDFFLMQYGATEHLKTDRCDPQRRPYSSSVNGWSIDCTESTRNLRDLPEGLACHLAASCSRIDCCLTVPFLANMTFNFVLEINMCEDFIYASFEEVEIKQLLLGRQIDWNSAVNRSTEVVLSCHADTPGLMNTVEIANIFFADYTIRKKDKMFIIDLQIRVCYGEEICQVQSSILDRTEIPQVLCILEDLKNFSLKKWALDRGGDVVAGLSLDLIDTFLQKINLTDKLLEQKCDRLDMKYSPTGEKNWRNKCMYSSLMTLPDLSGLPMNCYINENCLKIDCCMSVESLGGLSINAVFSINTCEFMIEGHIETFQFSINILTYEWGHENEITIENIPFIKMKFSIYRLLALEMYVIDLSLHVCFGGDTCEINVVIFNNAQVPIPGCNMEQGFQIPDFNFDQWRGNDVMTPLLASNLMQYLDVVKFMQDKQCQHYQNPYKEVTDGWSSDCPKDIDLRAITDKNVHCHVLDYCTGIQCCMLVPLINWNFEVFLLIDTCNLYLDVSIERLSYTFPIYSYNRTTKQKIDIGGLFALEYSIENLKDSKLFVVNMQLSVCLAQGEPCAIVITVFEDLMLPKPRCDWEALDDFADFSLNTYLEENHLSLTDNLDDLAANLLLEKLDLARFLKNPPCTVNRQSADGWDSSCAEQLVLPVLPDDTVCSVPSHCTAVDCCVEFPFINRNLNFKVDLNTCDYTLTISIENVEFTRMTFRNVWGTHETFNLKGVLFIDYMIEKLEAEEMFIISVDIKVCLDLRSPCIIEIPILDDVLFPNIPCDTDGTTSFPDVSLSSMLAELNLDPDETLSDLDKSKITEMLGIGAFVKRPPCQRGLGIHNAVNGQWNKACDLDLSLPPLSPLMTCHIPSSCTGIDCCVDTGSTGLTFNIRVLLDACDWSLVVGIEAVEHKISLVGYNWNTWKTLNLKDYVKIEFKVMDLKESRKYLLSLNVQLCFESTCLPMETVLSDTSLPKPFCNFDDNTDIEAFSLEEFLKQNSLTVADSLSPLDLSKIIDQMDIGHYLKNPMCDRSSSPYEHASENWVKDCLADVTLLTLPEEVTCHLSESCGILNCCFDVPLLQRTFSIQIAIDFCDYSFVMAIENFRFHKSLNFYTFGTWQTFSLNKFVKIFFMIADLWPDKTYVMSASVSLCWETDSCSATFPLLSGAVMPKPACDFTSTDNLAGLDLDSFLMSLNANNMQTLTTSIADQLFEIQGIGKYLKNPQCSQTSDLFQPSNEGWKNDCALPGVDSFLSALTDSTCHIGSVCTEIECCVKTSFLPRMFNAVVSVDMCNYVLTLAFENFEHKEILLDYNWGQPGQFYVKGILRIDYELLDYEAERKLEMTVKMSICLEQTSCLYSKTLLNKVKIPKPFCDWRGMLAARSLSVSKWMKDQGLRVGFVLNTVDEAMVSQLQHELGVAPYLLTAQCQLTDSIYSTTENNVCLYTSVQLTQLTSEVKCHISGNCSTIDCCVEVPYVKRMMHFTFDLDICRMTLDLGIENLKYSVSLLKYKWNTEDEFILGSLGRLIYKLEHSLSQQKIVADVSLEFCIGAECFLTISVLSRAEIFYSPCSSAAPEPFRGVSLDFWNPTKCTISTRENECSMTLSDDISDICSVVDGCVGIKCCMPVDFKYLGFYSLSVGINIDQCGSNQKLNIFIENKSWQKELSTLTLDTDHTEAVGEAITVTYRVSKLSTTFKVTLTVNVCMQNGIDLSEYCFEKQLLDQQSFESQCGPPAATRRKRSTHTDGPVVKTQCTRELVAALVASGSSNAQIKSAFDELTETEAQEVAELQTPLDGDISNVKSAARMMGDRNPATLLYSSPSTAGVDTAQVEGADEIIEILGGGIEVAGRENQAFIVGKGLTNAGLKRFSAKIANLTLGEITAWMDMKNIDPELAIKLARSIRDLTLALATELIKGFSEIGEDMFSSFDLTLSGDFSFPRQDVELFLVKHTFPLGVFITLRFEFGAGASYGVDITVAAKILSMQVTGVLRPFSNVRVFGSMGLGVLNVFGKLRLSGFLMEVSFPSTAEIVFSKFPLDVVLNVDLELIPLQLKLAALVTVDLFVSEITVFKTDLWKYTTALIKKNVLHVDKKHEDTSPPQVLLYVDNIDQNDGRQTRSSASNGGCVAKQLADRDYTEAAVEIAVRAEDDVSQVKLTVNVGTEPGLDDVVSGITLGGPSSIITHDFQPHGQKLYFTVIARNSGGGSTTVLCSIPTYDITPPGGRVLQEFLSTSNPTVLKASVVIFEDSKIEFSALGIGFGKGIYGDETYPYTEINLKQQTMDSYDATSDPRAQRALEYFIPGRRGRLHGPVIAEFKDIQHAGECLQKCLALHGSKCLSVNFDFGDKGVCELMESIDGHEHKVSEFGRFMHYERKGVGLVYEIVERDLDLGHNLLHYFNIHLRNDLHYTNIISSEGILVDLTPPTPGPLQNVSLDIREIVPCLSTIPNDRPDWRTACLDVSDLVKNHRIIHDGPGSMTVFNGDTPLEDLLYTRSNKYVAANWDGIEDRESGLLGFTWTVGRDPCEELIHPHHDPHKHFFDQSEWTNIGLISPIPPEHNPLPDGLYYITVRALNDVQYGGPLSTTVCHTTPYAIDNTKPFVHEVYNVKYDEVTFVVRAQYNATDPESHIKEVDICIGETTNDCYIMQWQRLVHSETGVSYVFEILGGAPAWVKIRAINNVDLTKVRSADSPIVIDTSPPIPGTVYDGPVYEHDLSYTKENSEICANWADFFDKESGIAFYTVQLQNSSMDLLVELDPLPRDVHRVCIPLAESMHLAHNETYYVTVWASNAGHKQLNSSAVSDGTLIDLTPPVPGEIIDGKLDDFQALAFSLHRSTVAAQWRDFSDPESDITNYELEVSRAAHMSEDFRVIQNWKSVGSKTANSIEWHHFHLNHRDEVKAKLRVTNGALNTVEVETAGFVVDLTAPVVVYLNDGGEADVDAEYQSSVTTLQANFLFEDAESGLDYYKYQVFELFGGNKHQIYPTAANEWMRIDDPSSTVLTTPTLELKPGAMYTIRVAAVNRAGALGIYITDGVLVDDTPPDLRWVHVGIFEGDEEEVVDGVVMQQDADGIKATWFATDTQSGVAAYLVAVGTTKGGTDVVDWTSVKERDRYIDNLSLTDGQMYYVTVKAINGAGMESTQITAKPLLKVNEDKAGIVIDGPEGTDGSDAFTVDLDINFQKDFSTVTVQFHGFTSHEHGIRHFDWGVGTTAGGEELRQFMVADLVHEESETDVPGNGIASSGFGQAVLPLEEGKKYYSTVRGITNSGKILHSTSDGVTVDISPPKITIESVAAQGTPSPGGSTIYQEEEQSINARWVATDDQSPVTTMGFTFGTYPYGSDLQTLEHVMFRLEGYASLPSTFIPETQGIPNILTVIAENTVGLVSRVFFPTVVVDNTPPTGGTVSCPNYIQPHSPVVCVWNGFFDAESRITEIRFQIGSSEGSDDVLGNISLPGHTTMYIAKGLEDRLTTGIFFATVQVVNILGMSSSASSGPMMVDTTPPVAGVVVELSSIYHIDVTSRINTDTLNPFQCHSAEECEKMDSVCHQSYTSISIAFTGFEDPETGIHRYQVAVGNTPGGGQLRPLFDIPLDKHYLTVEHLMLKGERQVFVTVLATNGAGLATMATSNGVFMSYLSQGEEPLSHIAVSDTDGGQVDVDFQTSTSSLSAMWDVSGDPCPVEKYEWAIERADGFLVQEFTNAEGRLVGVNDDLEMIGKEQYYIKLRVTNKEGFTYTVWSNGVQIEEDPLKPGNVYVGGAVGFTLKFLPTMRKVTANWDSFGNDGNEAGDEEAIVAEDNLENSKTLSNQEVAYYELALGTDRRFPKTRDNIVPFVNVGLNKTHTFFDLDDLIPYKAVYYFTVRAHSTSGARTQITSNGFSVGYDGGVEAGYINMERYVNTRDVLSIQWDGFSSEVGIMMYYVGVSTTNEADNYTCSDFTESGSLSDEDMNRIFDVVPMHNVGRDMFFTTNSLDLQQNAVYYAWVIGSDTAGKCEIVMFKFRVDLTPPEEGVLRTGPYYNLTLTYAPVKNMLDVSWKNYTDKESGIKWYYVSLLRKASCDEGAAIEEVVKPIKLTSKLNHYQFILDFDLEPNHPYFVELTAKNHASLSTTSISPPILYDKSKPTAGRVAKGHNFRDDIVWFGSVSTFTGSFLHLPTPSGDACPANSMPFDAIGWSFLNTDRVYDTSERKLRLSYSTKYVHVDKNELRIKVMRSPGEDLMLSGAYYRHADMLKGGKYELKIKAAKPVLYPGSDWTSDDQVVTSVIFWDGPPTLHYFLDLNYVPKDNLQDASCACCDNEPVDLETCGCDCTSRTRIKRFADTIAPEYQVKKVDAENLKKLESGVKLADVVTEEKKQDRQRSCGLQIYGGEMKKVVAWCAASEEIQAPLVEEYDLNFDPADDFHDYTLNFYIQKDESKPSEETWCFSVYIDGELVTENCGVPHLSDSTHLILAAWNHNNGMPDNTYDGTEFPKVWRAIAEFRDLVMPPDSSFLCRVGAPFRGGNNAVVGYEAGIGSSPLKDDVAQFVKINSPCIPCYQQCDRSGCEVDCNRDETQLIQFQLDGLDLPMTEVIDGKKEPIAYFLTVKAVLGSGMSAVASSEKFNIDVFPPVFAVHDAQASARFLMYTDVAQGMFKPTRFQQSNDTIKVTWICTDDESDIVDYQWSIGTLKGGQDVQNYTSVGEMLTGQNSGLVLNDHQEYFVSVKCTNGAGMTTTYEDSESITVMFLPPDSNDVVTQMVGSEPIPGTIPQNARQSMDSNSISASWQLSSDPDIERYDICVGSSPDFSQDILPCIPVAMNTAGTAEIKDGWLWVSGTKFQKLNNYRQGNTEDLPTSRSAFHMAPGSVLFVSMQLCNKANACSPKLVGSQHVISEATEIRSAQGGQSIQLNSNGIAIETPLGLPDGQSMALTGLSQAELAEDYRSDASADYVPYITNPEATLTSAAFVDRRLNGRLTYDPDDISFSLTSVGGLRMPGPMEISFPYNPSNVTSVESLLYFDPDVQKWMEVKDTCQYEASPITYDAVNSQVTVKMCNTRQSNAEADEVFFSEPTQFLLTDIQQSISNSPPQLTSTTSVSMLEDAGTLLYQMTYFDPDYDTVQFALDVGPDPVVFGNLTVTVEGLFIFTPCSMCYGTANVSVILNEVPVPEIPPQSTVATVTIAVLAVQNPPVIFVFDQNSYILLPDRTAPVEILVEENLLNSTDTIQYDLFVGGYDVDSSDSLTMLVSDPSNGSVVVGDVKSSIPACAVNTLECYDLVLPMTSDRLTWSHATLTYTPSSGFHGFDEVRVYVQDDNGSMSDIATLTFVVMERPCQHGSQCQSNNESSYTCIHTNRAVSFDDHYTCVCLPGWEGVHCGVNVDECSSSPCGWPYVCWDGVDGYHCSCAADNPNCAGLEPWMTALIAVSVVMGTAASVIAWYIYMIRRGRLKWSSVWDSISQKMSRSSDKTPKHAFVNEGYIENEFHSAIETKPAVFMTSAAPPISASVVNETTKPPPSARSQIRGSLHSATSQSDRRFHSASSMTSVECEPYDHFE